MRKLIGGGLIALAGITLFAGPSSATEGKYLCVDGQTIFVLYEDLWLYVDDDDDNIPHPKGTVVTEGECITPNSVPVPVGTVISTTSIVTETSTMQSRSTTTGLVSTSVGINTTVSVPVEIDLDRALPETGQEDTWKVIIAGTLLLAGAIMVFTTRRKRVYA